jgi:predicted transcriptional regulator
MDSVRVQGVSRTPEIVPGMAEAIERRRVELGLSPGDFAKAAGVTTQGLQPLRKGVRKDYQLKLKAGAARALGWTSDSIDRLLAGQDPIELPNGQPATEDKIEAALNLMNDRLAEVIRLLEQRERGGGS